MMVLSSLINLALDPLFIFGVGGWEGWGLPGQRGRLPWRFPLGCC